MTCDHCGQEFLRSGQRDVRSQVVRRSASGVTLVARCWSCGKEMTFYLVDSPVNRQLQQQRRDAIRQLERKVRQRGHDTDAAHDAEEDREIVERRRHGEDA